MGGFGISDPKQLLCVQDVRLIRQQCTAVTVEFDDEAVADYFDTQVDQGRTPEQFARLWIHTHPGDCALPSGTDEETFARCFGSADWAVMFILAAGGAVYARLQMNVGPCVSVRLNVDVDFESEFAATDHADWDREYDACVSERDPFQMSGAGTGTGFDASLRGAWSSAGRDVLLRFEDPGHEVDRADDDDGGDADDDDELAPQSIWESGADDFTEQEPLSGDDVDDWYERWLADAIFDPEVSESESAADPEEMDQLQLQEYAQEAFGENAEIHPVGSGRKEERWNHQSLTAHG